MLTFRAYWSYTKRTFTERWQSYTSVVDVQYVSKEELVDILLRQQVSREFENKAAFLPQV